MAPRAYQKTVLPPVEPLPEKSRSLHAPDFPNTSPISGHLLPWCQRSQRPRSQLLNAAAVQTSFRNNAEVDVAVIGAEVSKSAASISYVPPRQSSQIRLAFATSPTRPARGGRSLSHSIGVGIGPKRECSPISDHTGSDTSCAVSIQ